MEQLTPAEKRKLTMQQRYGKDWRKKVGQLAKDGKIEKNGEDGYSELQSKAGSKGAAQRPAGYVRPFAKDKKLAKEASAKGLKSRWGQNAATKDNT